MSYASRVAQQKAINRAKELARKKKAGRKAAAPKSKRRRRYPVLSLPLYADGKELNARANVCSNCRRIIEPHIVGTFRRYEGHYPEDCKK